MQMNQIIKSTIGISAILSSSAFAGGENQEAALPAQQPITQTIGWGDLLDSLGTPIYKNKENPFVQEIDLFGRLQWQYGYVDGEDVNGDDFTEDLSTYRRSRVGGKIKFLDYFTLKTNINVVSDNRFRGRDLDWGYQSFDEAKLTFDLGKAVGEIGPLESVKVTYGRQKVKAGKEVHTSSKKIKTVERSALSNMIFPDRATGLLVETKSGGWKGALGVYSNEGSDFIADWDQGVTAYASTSFEVNGGDEVLLDFYTNLDNENTDAFGNKWAVSAAYTMERGRFGLVTNLIAAEADDLYYGLIVLPTYELVEDKIELVGRLTYARAEGTDNLQLNSRFVRSGNHGGAVNSGRGDEHYSAYAGLNFYLHGDKSKIMTGIEYDNLDTSAGDVKALTTWLAYRMYF